MTRALSKFAALFCAQACASLCAYTAKDMDGREFEFAAPPKIASITPSVSETVARLGMDGSLVGVSRYCEYPPVLKSKPRLGGFIDPDYEKILTLRPDIVIIPKTSDAVVRGKLERLGIPCFLTYPDGIENVSKNVLLIGAVLGRDGEAKKIADEIEREIAPRGGARGPKAVFLFGRMAAGKGSFVGGLLERAGFENVAAKSGKAWPVLSREFILANPPDVIILEAKEGETALALAQPFKDDPLWARTPAVKNGKIYTVESQAVIVPGPRIAKAAKRLREIAEDARK